MCWFLYKALISSRDALEENLIFISHSKEKKTTKISREPDTFASSQMCLQMPKLPEKYFCLCKQYLLGIPNEAAAFLKLEKARRDRENERFTSTFSESKVIVFFHRLASLNNCHFENTRMKIVPRRHSRKFSSVGARLHIWNELCFTIFF